MHHMTPSTNLNNNPLNGLVLPSFRGTIVASLPSQHTHQMSRMPQTPQWPRPTGQPHDLWSAVQMTIPSPALTPSVNLTATTSGTAGYIPSSVSCGQTLAEEYRHAFQQVIAGDKSVVMQGGTHTGQQMHPEPRFRKINGWDADDEEYEYESVEEDSSSSVDMDAVSLTDVGFAQSLQDTGEYDFESQDEGSFEVSFGGLAQPLRTVFTESANKTEQEPTSLISEPEFDTQVVGMETLDDEFEVEEDSDIEEMELTVLQGTRSAWGYQDAKEDTAMVGEGFSWDRYSECVWNRTYNQISNLSLSYASLISMISLLVLLV
ncbi:hypothetical protein BDN72DRAFT_882384 [Pluteus cervinus]|uniref:Uncharacterized protein n=1 Tax=Pluteus cervinus TaxID=181527 RepID=A0ACD3ABC9_9AGAR|nr:hypothetical protein BDN72DRAFT_882384 [Pluteus cervinus]